MLVTLQQQYIYLSEAPLEARSIVGRVGASANRQTYDTHCRIYIQSVSTTYILQHYCLLLLHCCTYILQQ